jgi:hypothetical protein
MKNIAFVGQLHYFGVTIPRHMNGFKIYELNINFEPGDPSRFDPVLELNKKEKIDYWVFFRGEFTPQFVLDELEGKKINISTEPIGREDVQRMYLGVNKPFFIEHFKHFDYFTHYDSTEIPELKCAGFDVDCEFPLPVDIDTYKPDNIEKIYDLIFMGRSTTRRAMLTGPLKKDYNFLHVDHGMWGTEAVRCYNQAKIGLNLNVSTFKQNQHRIFNMMACGLPIISDEISHTNWLHQDDEIYFKFVKNADSRTLYAAVSDMLEDSTVPLKIRGQIMRRIAVTQFNAAKKWPQLIEKVDYKWRNKK